MSPDSRDVRRGRLLERTGAFARKFFREWGVGDADWDAAEDGREYFFHRTGLDPSVNFDSLAGGERVNFEIEPSQKGPRANRIKLA